MTLLSKKQIKTASQLDVCASRAGHRGATAKQCFFLAKLIIQNNENFDHIYDSSYVLSKKEASESIDFLLNN